VKTGLTIKPLQSLCDDFKQDIVDGPFGSELKREDYINEGVPVLKIQNVKPFAIELKKMDYVSIGKFQELRRHSYRPGDIVMTKLGSPLGVSAIVENLDEGVIVADLVRVRAQRINTKYLCYHLNSQRTNDFLNSMQKGTTRPRVTLSAVRELPIVVPSPDEQQRIVGILDEAFAGLTTAKANAQKNLQNARALLESHLQSVFSHRGEGWVEKPLCELCDIKHGYAFAGEFFSNDGEYVLLTPGNFYETGGYRDRGEKQRYYTGEVPRDYILTEGDLLVAMTEQAAGLLGSPILVPESERFLHNQRLGLVTKKPDVAWTNEFFFHVFNTRPVRKSIHDSASGVKVRHTSPTKIGAVVVTFPTSIAEQRRIVSTLVALTTETQRLEAIYQQKLAALDALKKSLLHQAFSGKL
jgi:type I restriction enzyme S subunit